MTVQSEAARPHNGDSYSTTDVNGQKRAKPYYLSRGNGHIHADEHGNDKTAETTNGHTQFNTNGFDTDAFVTKSSSVYMALGEELLQQMSIFDQSVTIATGDSPSILPIAGADLSAGGELARRKIVQLAERILASTEEPRLNLMVSSLQFHFCACLKVIVDLDIAPLIPRDTPMSVCEIARATHAEEALLSRVMRVLTAKFVFEEVSPGFYGHTAMSWAMRAPGQKYLLTHRLEESFRSASREAEALRQNNYREPILDDKYGFHLAFATNSNYWEYTTKQEPKLGKNFNSAMKVVNMNDLAEIPSLYPFERLNERGGLIIDVGGGLGQVGRRIVEYHKGKGLKCIVQDVFVEEGNIENVTMMRHDFFDPQPVKGAAAYFFRHIFHDWPDSACIDILRQIIPAMDRENSCILICDQVVEEENPAASSVLYDIDMMSLYGGKERKLSEWVRLLKEADPRLYVSDLRVSPSSPHIIEVRLG